MKICTKCGKRRKRHKVFTGAIMKRISLIAGCRPNFVKAAAILKAAEKYPQFQFDLIHAGQHRGVMSDPYFRDLRLPEPAFTFGPYIGSSIQRLSAMTEMLSQEVFESRDYRPDAVMVVGDTDSTLAGALAAAKCGIPVAHVEAGLRCGDMRMQEEINRRLVDSITSYAYCTSQGALENFDCSSDGDTRAVLVGNVMVDTLYRFLPEALSRYPKRLSPYAVFTLHRAENVDNYEEFERIVDAVAEVSKEIPIVWPAHPRIAASFKDECALEMTSPMGYLEFLSTMANAEFVMTDSGGVQEETTALGVKCITLRDTTERPETIFQGSNCLGGTESGTILKAVKIHGFSSIEQFPTPYLWDGHAAERILEDLCETL